MYKALSCPGNRQNLIISSWKKSEIGHIYDITFLQSFKGQEENFF